MNSHLAALCASTQAALDRERARLACPGCGVACDLRRMRTGREFKIFHNDGPKRCFFDTLSRGREHMGSGRTVRRALAGLRLLGRDYRKRKTL